VAPKCDDLLVADESQFHREIRRLPHDDALFFDARPVLLAPLLDGFGVLLSCHAARFLGRESQIVQDATDVVSMVRDTKLFAYDLRNSSAGPQVGTISSRKRTFEKNLDERLSLFLGKFPPSTGMRFGG